MGILARKQHFDAFLVLEVHVKKIVLGDIPGTDFQHKTLVDNGLTPEMHSDGLLGNYS